MKHRLTVLVVATQSLLALLIFIASTSALVAQDTPIGVPGTQLATEQTPAAAANAMS